MEFGQFELRPIRGDDSIVAIELRGDLDLANAERFEKALRDLRDAGPIVLDLSSATYCDSAGFAALDRLLGEGDFELVVDRDSVMRRAAAILGVRIHDDLGSARAALRP